MYRAFFVLLAGVFLGPAATAQTPTRLVLHGQSEGGSTLADQTDVAVTVYNANRALVRDQRRFRLNTGTVDLKFMDVATEIQPETVSMKSLAETGSIQVLEQNYEYDLMSPDKLMEKYVGRQVTLISQESDYNFNEVQAELLSVNNGPVYRVGDRIFLGHPGTVVLPELPEALIAKPTLVWKLDNDRAEQEVEVTYLTGGIGWKADYVLSLDRSETKLGIEGWVTLDNHSGATYTDARVKLVAGDVNVIQEQPQRVMRMMAMDAMAAAPMPEEEAFGEYHLYTLPRRSTIKENQTKQVSLLRAEEVTAKKTYEYSGRTDYYYRRVPPIKNDKVAVYLEFENTAANGLGIPLPGGAMRVYQPDSEGMPQFSGEDRIDHTPKDEDVRIKLGNAFDVVAERTQTDYANLGPNRFESTFEIVLRNHKDTAVTVEVVEPMRGDWEITQSTQVHEKRDAFTALFRVEVPADGEKTFTYTARVTGN